LRANSNVVGCSTGRSAGCPLKPCRPNPPRVDIFREDGRHRTSVPLLRNRLRLLGRG
jgi:hypothetical protein